MKIIFLGTGRKDVFPTDRKFRANASEVIQIERDNLLFDCGRWINYRLTESKVMPRNITRFFITHHWHYDHTADIPPFLLTRGRTREKLHIYGTEGVKKFIDDIGNAFRQVSKGQWDGARSWEMIDVQELTQGGLVCETDKWKVSCALTNHGLGYRVDAEGKSIVVSGDINNFSTNDSLKKLAQGADVYIMDADVSHNPPEALGRAAEEAGVKIAVLTHVHDPGTNLGQLVQPEYDDFKKMVGKFFTGKIVLADDLKTLEI